MRGLSKYLFFILVCAVLIYSVLVFPSVEGFAYCAKRSWGVCVSSIPVLGERCSGTCHTGTCQNGLCLGSAKVGARCGNYDCANPGPSGRDTYCSNGVCAEVPKMSFN